jgi:chromosome segregation ATPase
MGRVVRSLLKLPAVKRVMLRLANAEAAITRQQAQLAELGGQAQRLSADDADHRALLAEVAQHMPPERRVEVEAAISQQQAQLGRMNERIQRLIADEARHHALLAEVAEHMPPARLRELEATIQGQQAELRTLNATIEQQQAGLGTLSATVQTQQSQLGSLGDRVQQLSAGQDSQRALLGEVAQHLPPAQRANLEATLHGQQLQLGALNATMHANQIQLTSLNEIVQRLSTEAASQRELLSGTPAQVTAPQLVRLEATIAEQQAKLGTLSDLVHQLGAARQEQQALAATNAQLTQENRLLRVGHGATFEELDARGKASTGAPYRFEELLSLQNSPKGGPPSVPPLVHLHVPKAAGTTLNSILMRNYKYRADSYGTDFFPRYFPSEFLSLVEAPPTEDDRIRPMFFTGHIGLENELFQRMPVPYAAITILRNPVSRIISHYRFNSTAPSIFQTAIQEHRLDVVEYFHRFRSAIPLQWEYFAPSSKGNGEGNPRRVTEALRNLDEMISIFGIQDEFDEFVVLLAELLGLPDVFYVPLNKTPENAATVTQEQIDELRKILADDVTFYEEAAKLYRRRTEALPFDLAARTKEFEREKKSYLKLRGRRKHPWNGSYS